MSRVIEERSPRTLLDAAHGLRNALYDGGSSSLFTNREVVITASKDAPSVAPKIKKAINTGFILREVEDVLKEIRKDLDIAATETEGSASQPLMTRIRTHTDEISNMLTGSTMMHPNDGTTTISQLIKDINRLKASVENQSRTSCVIS